MPGSALVLDFISPMELHLLLGVMNHLYKFLPKSLNIKCQPIHGDQFAGNECRKLLKNVDVLQQLAEKNCAFCVFGIIDTLQKFDAVVSACFGNSLKDDYALKID